MHWNGLIVGRGYSDEISDDGKNESFSFQWTLSLKTGDEIWLEIISISPGVYLIGDYETYFSDFLLEENIVMA